MPMSARPRCSSVGIAISNARNGDGSTHAMPPTFSPPWECRAPTELLMPFRLCDARRDDDAEFQPCSYLSTMIHHRWPTGDVGSIFGFHAGGNDYSQKLRGRVMAEPRAGLASGNACRFLIDDVDCRRACRACGRSMADIEGLFAGSRLARPHIGDTLAGHHHRRRRF